MLERHEVKLHVLASGQVSFPAAKIVRDSCQLPHLVRSQSSARDLGAYHLHASLPLPINASPKPERPELVVRKLAGEEGIRLRPKQFDVFSNCPIVLMLSELLFREDVGSSHNLYFPIENIIIDPKPSTDPVEQA
jgi:hypothetical protein